MLSFLPINQCVCKTPSELAFIWCRVSMQTSPLLSELCPLGLSINQHCYTVFTQTACKRLHVRVSLLYSLLDSMNRFGFCVLFLLMYMRISMLAVNHHSFLLYWLAEKIWKYVGNELCDTCIVMSWYWSPFLSS